jgi:CheY-like chemotaxis protein
MNLTTTSTRILYADDDCDDHFFLRESISCTGLPADIVYLTDGDQVIHYLENNRDALPSLIVLDLNMPRLNGKQTLERLKTDNRFSDIPVIILSTSNNRTDKEFCTSRGAASYLVKPGHFEGYQEVVRNFVPFLQVSC